MHPLYLEIVARDRLEERQAQADLRRRTRSLQVANDGPESRWNASISTRRRVGAWMIRTGKRVGGAAAGAPLAVDGRSRRRPTSV